MEKRQGPQTVVTEDELTYLHPELWRAQTLCTILLGFVEHYVDEEQTRLDIQNTVSMVNELIASVHNKINGLEELAIRGKREAA